MADPAVKANELVKWFGEGEAKTYAVKNVSFEAYFGEMLYIEGPSGSGKTTLLSMISGILRPNSGNVMVDNKEIWSLTSDQIADFRLNTVGFVFQDYHLFSRLTTVENVAIPLILKKIDWDEAIKIAMEYLEIVGLKERAYLTPVKLSGGEQQRVAFARALANDPPLLLVDEPTGNLDRKTSAKIIEILRILNDNGKTVLVATHDEEILKLADQKLRLEEGKLVKVNE